MQKRMIIGLVLLAVAAAIIVGLQVMGGSDEDENGGPSSGSDVTSVPRVQIITGYIGGEKEGFLQNPKIQQILRDRYYLEVDFTRMGSIDLVRADSTGLDFLWPSNEVALQLYRDDHPGVAVKTETIFNSPIVMYSWPPIVDALIAQGIVELQGGVYYVINTAKMVDLIIAGTHWQDIGLPQLFGNVSVISTDPTRSNSGNMFYGLLANLLVAENNPANTVATDATIEAVLPTIKAYYDSLGFLPTGSGEMWDSFVSVGMSQNPIIVGYESQLIEFSIEQAANPDQVNGIRVLYPRPTVWSSHPIIALTDGGEKLMEALQDPEILDIAWREHGFRTGFGGMVNDPQALSVTGIPEDITAVLPLPRPTTMERIIEYLQTGR